MGRYKKGCRKKIYRWEIAGGKACISKAIKSALTKNSNTSYSSVLWPEVSLNLFGNANKDNCHWLWVVWSKNRRGLRSVTVGNARESEDGNEDDDEIENKDGNGGNEVDEGTANKEGDGGSPSDEDMENKGDGVSTGDEGTVNKEGDGRSMGEEDMGNKEGDGGSTGDEVMENEGDGASTGDEDTENKGDGGSTGYEAMENEGDGASTGDEDTENKGDAGSTGDENTGNKEDMKNKEGHGEGTISCLGAHKGKREIYLRRCPAVKKRFMISLPNKVWKSISPDKNTKRLRTPWTNIFYQYFKEKNPCCPLSFKNLNIKSTNSRKIISPYLNVSARCTFKSCTARYKFKIQEKPTDGKKVRLTVLQTGEIKHGKKEKKSRPATGLRRGRIARVLRKGISNYFYNKMRTTPAEELISGNMSSTLSKDVLKVIASEFRKNSRVHDNVLIEMHRTQAIIKECDTNCKHLPGYVQHFQLEPFSVHLYTETGLSITSQHLKKRGVTLYLDATDNVVSKIPGQKTRILYYALTLPGSGKDSPPLPVCEMLTNEHSTPPITFWLMQFNRHLSRFTKTKVSQVETDFSWALMQGVLLAFNKESIPSYLERAINICSESLTWCQIKHFTILHLCSAHILKAFAHAIGKKTTDKGLKEFAIYVFALLQNCTCLKRALTLFHSICILFQSETKGNTTDTHLLKLQQAIKDQQNTQLPGDTFDRNLPVDDEVEKNDANKVVKGSPFTFHFRKVMEEAEEESKNAATKDEDQGNPYYCPGILDLLFNNYIGLFPLWSGVLLGDLRRYATDKRQDGHGKTSKSRDTNCHVERWFGIVKHSILRKKLRLRPGAFVRKMNSTLQGRYREHSLHHNLAGSSLTPLKTKDLGQSQKSWAKTENNQSIKRSKYFAPPQKMPVPKKRQNVMASKAQDVPAQSMSKSKKKEVEKTENSKKSKVEDFWCQKPTERVVAVVQNRKQRMTFTLRHPEILSLKPNGLIIGEAMECYVRASLNAFDPACRLYQLNHHSMGVILHGTREQMARQGLREVAFDDYDGVIGFVNTGNHWKFVYLHALTQTIYVVDPLHASNEVADSKMAARRFGEYFKMRRNRLGKEDWVATKWKPGTIPHTFQKAQTSCGVFVMQMAKMAVMGFPQIPQNFNIDPSKKSIRNLRKEMAEEILKQSLSSNDFCTVCGLENLNQKTCWIQCEKCLGWLHLKCIGMQQKQIPTKETPWYCQWCQPLST